MNVPIRVEAVDGRGYVARDAFGVTADGPTASDAVANLRTELARQVATGAFRVVQVNDPSITPAVAAAGIFKDDPLFDDWVATMQENRRKQDAEDAALLAAELEAERGRQ